MEGQILTWPYGFRFEWKLKRVFRQSTGPGSDEDELTTKIRPSVPTDSDTFQHIPNHVGDQIQSTALSFLEFEKPLNHLQVSSDTKRIVMQRVLADMAGNEREALLCASSWWRQLFLDHGSGYVDAIVTHCLYKHLTEDLSSAEWQKDGPQPAMTSGSEEVSQRREDILAAAPDHIAGHSDGEDSDDVVATVAYLARAEVIRELIIFANTKICTTTPAKENGKDLSMDTLVGDLMTPFNDNDDFRARCLEKSKRIACIVQLHDLCEQNNWTLVACHVETQEVISGRKLFRRMLSVVSKMEDDPTRAKASIRPAIEPFPMLSLEKHCSSEDGREVLEWDRCSPDDLTPASQFYPLIDDYEDLVKAFGRHDKDADDILVRPENMSRALLRKVKLFDYFDDEDDRAINPFAHFRHAVDDLLHTLRTDARPLVQRHLSQTQSIPGTPLSNRLSRTASQGSHRGLQTPKRLLVRPYNSSARRTPSSNQHSPTSQTLLTPTRQPRPISGSLEVQIELLRSDLAILFRALLTARGIDPMSGNDAIASALTTSATFSKPAIDRLLANPTFQERFGALEEEATIDNTLPASQEEAKYTRKRLQEDTATVFFAVLESRCIDLAAETERIVTQLDSKLIPGEVAERALANSLVKARRRRKRKADREREREVKDEMAVVREKRERGKRRRMAEDGEMEMEIEAE